MTNKLLTTTGLTDPRDPIRKMKVLEELIGIIDSLRGTNKIVATNGCFDLLHPGHTRNLRESREQGDILIVGINTDRHVRETKGYGRPIYSQVERAEMLVNLECVDFVTVFEDSCHFVDVIRPDVYTNGPEYGKNPIEKKILDKYGGKLYIYKRHKDSKGVDFNTTAIVKRIKEA